MVVLGPLLASYYMLLNSMGAGLTIIWQLLLRISCCNEVWDIVRCKEKVSGS